MSPEAPVEAPRVAVAAPASGEGKTTVAVGLMAALRRRGLDVAPFKTGPDYIDPGYHALATGRPGRNLDAHLTAPELLQPLLRHGMQGSDVAVVEGAMGLFDGMLDVPTVGRAGFASCAHVVRATHTPLLLVLDASHSSRTLAAVAHGIATFDEQVGVDAVLLNRIGSERAQREARRALADVGLPVLGCIPRSRELVTPSRHLGLVPAAERDQATAMVGAAAALVERHVDLDAVLALAHQAPPLDCPPWDPSSLVTPVAGRPRIAVAAGRAFTFRYAEATELLVAAGCEVVEFDPLVAERLPEHTSGLYLGGGFPEVYATDLAANESLRDDVRRRVRDGLPTVAECAGLLYLCPSLDGLPMAGALDATAAMTPRLTLGYRTPVAVADSLLFRAGETVASHEFHRTDVTLVGPLPTVVEPVETPAAEPLEAPRDDAGTVVEPVETTPFRDEGAGAASGDLPNVTLTTTLPGGSGKDVAPSHGPSPLVAPVPPVSAWQVGDRVEGLCSPTLHASYQHLHWAGVPHAAQRFADAAARYATTSEAIETHDEAGTRTVVEPVETTTPDTIGHREPLDRLGDRLQVPAPAEAPSATTTAEPVEAPPSGARPRSPRAVEATPPTSHDLTHHGDADVVDGLVDLAVNVRGTEPPAWLAAVLARPERWAAYPEARPARTALARRHGVDERMVLPTSGAAEAFTLVARAFRPRRAVVVHPQFTEPEQALRTAGHDVDRVVLDQHDGFRLHPQRVPDDADLVVVGNPTNPTGVLHPAAVLRSLARPGRVLLVDEAFMDAVDGEPESLLGVDMAGILVTRSLTKTWSLAGLRAGYVVGDPGLVARLAAQQTAWSVSTPALDAMVACSTPDALAEAARDARLVARQREALVEALAGAGFAPVAPSRAPFVLVDTARLGPGSQREALQRLGFAARRGETFPGLGPTHLRLAVRDEATSRRLAAALTHLQENQ